MKREWYSAELAPYLDDVMEHELGRTKDQVLIRSARQIKNKAGEAVFIERA